MKTIFASFWLLSGAAYAQEGFSPTLPWGTRTQTVQAGEIRNNTGFSPTMPYVKVSDHQPNHDNPHQDPRYCPTNGYRPYSYYNNYYYGPGSGYYYNNYNGYGQTATPSTPNQGIPGYDTPLPSTPPPGVLSLDLALYLEQLAQEGSPDSQGSFSVDYARALEKLSQRLFGDPTSWLIKLVQAAAASGARELRIRPLRDRLEVQFTSPGFKSADFEDVQTLLHQPLGSQAQPALAHFLRAFHASRSARPQTLGWAVVDEQAGFSYVVRAEETQRQTMPGRSGAGCDCVLSLRPQTPGTWVDEQRALAGRCALSPLAIRWDGRLLNPGVPQVGKHVLLDRVYLSRQPVADLLHLPHLTQIPSLVYDLGHGYRDHYSYGQTLLHQWRSYRPTRDHKLWEAEPAPDFPILESDVIQEIFGIPKGAYAINHGLIRSGRLGGRNNGYQILFVNGLDQFALAEMPVAQGRFGLRRPLCAQAWLRCPVQPEGQNQLVIQQDGVLLDPIPVELGLSGARAFLSDATIQTDLSGLVPVRDQRVEQIEGWLHSETVRCRKEVRKALRWGSKYGYSEAAVEQISSIHGLDQD